MQTNGHRNDINTEAALFYVSYHQRETLSLLERRHDA